MNRFVRIVVALSLSLVALGRCQSAYGQINAEQVMRIGQNALYFDDYVVSIQYFNQAIQAKPYLAMPYFYRSIAKLNLEDYLGAEADATAAIERNPFIADAYEVRGVARQNQGNSAGAVDDYNHALKLLPDNRGLMFNKAIAQEDIKDFEGAAATYEQLLKSYPRYENGYMGRARLELEMGDTVAASADLDRALELNRNLSGAYVMRAEIAMKSGDNERLQGARDDMDEAIKLQPKSAGLYINRAYVRYKLDDFRGALEDYETSISLDPINPVPYFNRGLLRMETLDNDRALTDFSQVLQLDPNDYRALYNRAMIYTAKRDYASAIADISRVVDAFPDFAGAVYTRFTIYNEMGDRRNAMADYDRAMDMFKKDRRRLQESPVVADSGRSHDSGNRDDKPSGSDAVAQPGNGAASAADDAADMARESAEEVARRFSTLRTIENNVEVAEDHNNKNIRGKVQDRNRSILLEPMFKLSFYADEDAIDNSAIYYIAEVNAANATRALRQPLVVTLHDTGPSSEDEIARHFQSVDYYNSYISTHTPRAIDYLGRGMDFMMLHNYQAAILDFGRAVELTPDFTIAYFMRAVARYKDLKAREGADAMDGERIADRHVAGARTASAMAEIIADIDRVISLSPRMALAYYNRGNMLAETGDIDGAIAAYSRAVELEPGLGVAYYNRGYLYLQQGDGRNGSADLSRAGELGIASSYNLLKRMNR
ncbi:MAG: tetratricopeptide repeat protein [Muribaculaceae bacterium]|nr:tetratricopeptide repeat protein [Muribaculaceae bacterium]